MASEASINGISKYGYYWSNNTINISKYCELIGEMEEPLSPIEHEQLREHSYNISQVIKDFIDKLRNSTVIVERVSSLLEELEENNLEDIEFLEELKDIPPLEGDLDDVRFALNRLYDTFDYYRVLVK